MSEARLADALARLEQNKNLRLPLRSRDLLGRLSLRFWWRRQVKWQVELNNAVADAVDALREITARQQDIDASRFATHDQLRSELEQLRRSDQNLTSGLNQRLYSAIGGLRTEISDLRLRLTDKAEGDDAIDKRLTAIEAGLAELSSSARDARLRHAQVDLFLDRARATARDEARDEVPSAPVPERGDYLELAVAELLDGPSERTRTARATYLPVITQARDGGAFGPVFDVAPGRGEWLDLLRAADIPSRAASANPVVVRHCAEQGHSVAEQDPLAQLAAIGGRSLGAVLAFRYAERLSPGELARFVDLAGRALLPGGVLIVQTPATDAARDPFVRAPIDPSFLRFLAEAAGFGRVEIQRPDPSGLTPLAELATGEPRPADRYTLLAWL
ncbi:MAG TPA: hypothetical protein VJ914_21240 [Pseudonocardiaceae bacterium]|nr:hypothetical protein [Pseudonocardiaceae bacterium]